MIFRAALLLVVFLCQNVSYAQRRHYDIVNYTTDNGLPQNSITGIEFDHKGYCWLGTQMGLVRFDGQRFTLFNSDNIKGLKSDRIFNVTRDTAGNIFLRTGGIINVLKIDDRPSLAASVPVLLQKAEPEIPVHGFVAPLAHLDTIKLHPTSQTILGTAMGNMYLIQPTKSYYITPHRKVQLPIKETSPLRNKILLIGENLLIIRAHNKPTIWAKDIEQPVTELRGPLWTNPDFLKGYFTTPSNTDGAYIYAGKTLYRLSLTNNILYSEVILDGIEIPLMACLYFDKQNNRYYIGSAGSGLFIITPTDFYTPSTSTAGSAIGMDFYGQSVTEEGVISQNFLFRKDGTVKEYPLIQHQKATWYHASNRSLYYAPDLDLLRFDMTTGKTHTVIPLSTALTSIFPDPWQKDYLLFSTSFTIGKIANDTLVDEKKIQGLTKGQALFASYPAGQDTFLLATWSGIKWYDFGHNKIYRSLLDSFAIRQLYIEHPKRIWIASYGKGWYLYDKNRIVRMPDGPLDALKTVNAIIDGGRGYFWLSSNNGLFKVSKEALIRYAEGKSDHVYFYAFTTADHLPTNEFNAANPSYVWFPDSMLSLPTIKGLVWFYPHKVHLSLPDKGIYIEHIRMNQSDIKPKDGKLFLPPDHGRLNLKVSSPYFGNKENMKLEFRIEGLDEEWSTVPENGEIIIDRIPAGNYALEVRKVTGIDPGQYVRIVMPIQIKPYWYNTLLFYICLLLVTIGVVFWLTKLRMRLLRARNRKLETQVAVQTRHLNHMIRKLTHSEKELKLSNQTKDNIITTVLHDLRSPIRFIYMVSKHVATGHRKMQQDTLDMHLQELKNSTASLNSFTGQFFTWATSQHRSFSAKYSYEALAGLFHETEMLYADIMHANGNQLMVMPASLYCYTDPQLLSTVIRNLLDNANKYTSNGEIKLEATVEDKKIIITLSDTGRGFSPEALAAFLNKDKTGPRSGNGSFIIVYLLELIGGELEGSSEPGKGTTFRIILPHHDAAPDNTPAG